ncbi:biofilm formation regulator HmsP, partial [Serratia ureilytica]
MISGLFKLPIQIPVPLYSLKRMPANQRPLASLLLQSDSFPMYQFILSIFSTILSSSLLLALILSLSITWCMNRLMVPPLSALAKVLETTSQDEAPYHQLMLPSLHQDAGLGPLVRNYNRKHQPIAK